MGFERLRFFNFRNLKDRELDCGAREVFLVGENGQGKTNLLEAVHLLSLGSSFREKREAALVRDPSSATGLHGRLSSPDRGEKTLSLRLTPGHKKEFRVNDKALAERRDLLSEVLCIAFVQQDMDFVAGAPEDRRRFFDQTLVLSDLSFLDSLRELPPACSRRGTSASGKTGTISWMSTMHNSPDWGSPCRPGGPGS